MNYVQDGIASSLMSFKFDERVVGFLTLQIVNHKYVLIIQCHALKKIIFYLVISCSTIILIKK